MSTEPKTAIIDATGIKEGFFDPYRPWYSLFHCSGGSGDYVFGISVYGNPYYDKPWFQWTIKPLYRIGRKINDAKYWFMWRFIPRHQYNIVRTGLKPGYYDEDTLMLHACFAILGRYIESEGGIEAIRAEEGTIHVIDGDYRSELLALWDWWKIEKPADEKRRDEMVARLYGRRDDGTKRITWVKDGANTSRMVDMPTAEEEALEPIFRALEKKIDDDEQAMLHRLINIRRSLWS
jgi:hypothetical protein